MSDKEHEILLELRKSIDTALAPIHKKMELNDEKTEEVLRLSKRMAIVLAGDEFNKVGLILDFEELKSRIPINLKEKLEEYEKFKEKQDVINKTRTKTQAYFITLGTILAIILSFFEKIKAFFA